MGLVQKIAPALIGAGKKVITSLEKYVPQATDDVVNLTDDAVEKTGKSIWTKIWDGGAAIPKDVAAKASPYLQKNAPNTYANLAKPTWDTLTRTAGSDLGKFGIAAGTTGVAAGTTYLGGKAVGLWGNGNSGSGQGTTSKQLGSYDPAQNPYMAMLYNMGV